MLVLMLIVAGMAIALSIYFLLSGVFSFEPQLSADTVNYFGVLPSVLVFALCGPVLVLKLWFVDDGTDEPHGGVIGLLSTGSVALFWSAALGAAAIFGVATAIAPVVPVL